MNSETLKWADFTLIDDAGYIQTKAGTFYAATYGATKMPVTLLVSPTDTLTDTSHKIDAFSLSPVSKFTEDSIPVEFMSSSPAGKGTVYLIKYLTFTTVYFHLKNVKG